MRDTPSTPLPATPRADLALGVKLADFRFLGVGQAEGIGPLGTKIAGRWPKCRGADQ